MLEGFRVEQVIAPAPVEQGQVAGGGVLRSEAEQLEQGFHAFLFTLAHGFAQVADGLLFIFGDHTAATGGAVDQQFCDQSRGTLLAGLALGLLIKNQAFQLWPCAFQQQGEAFIQPTFTVFRGGHAVESHQRMQAQASQGFAPVRLAMVAAADEIKHRQQRLAATGQHLEFVAVLGQHRFAGVDHIQAGVGGQQLAQHLGFLFETLAGFTAIEEARQAGRAVEAFAGAIQSLQIIEQGDGIFQSGCVVQLQQGFAVHRQARAFDMPGGAGAMGDFAEAHVSGQRAQQ